ncbi:MAG: hypothetical protein WC503_01680 [Candidatus Shapirobacteria bacterium]
MKDKRFPTILGIILLLVILASGVYLSKRTTSLSTKASGSCEPVNPQIANLTYGSFDFSFLTTSLSCLATVSIDGKIIEDSSTVSNTHYFKITNLKPVTSYKFSLISGGVTYSPPEYSLITTVKPNSSIPDSNLAWGRVVDASLQPVSGAIIFLTIPGGQALSAFSNKDGNWNISFATSFNENKTDWFSPTTLVDEDLIVYSPDGKLTQLTNRSDNNDPVPDIIIGQRTFVPTITSSPVDNSDLGSGPATTLVNLSLTSPKESEKITTSRPDIFGQGPSNETFQLNLDGNSTNVTVAKDSIWHWSPVQNLSTGPHKLILTYGGKSITRNFSVDIVESNISFSATPSATLVPTQIIEPTKIPTQILLPTKIPTTIPTNKPTKVPTIRAAKPSTTSALYESGETFPTFFLIILSSLLFSVSLYYYRR